MENAGREPGFSGSRHSDLKKSFKIAVRSMLTACSKQEFDKAFSKFSTGEQDVLYRLYIQDSLLPNTLLAVRSCSLVVMSLHQSIEDAFETLCDETQVGAALDTVEQMVEEQGLDPLFPEKTSIPDIARDLASAKKKEIQYLTDLLQKAEEQNRLKQARIELLKKQRQDFSGTADTIETLKTGISGYFASNDGMQKL